MSPRELEKISARYHYKALLGSTHLNKLGLACMGEMIKETSGIDDKVVDQKEGLLGGDGLNFLGIHNQATTMFRHLACDGMEGTIAMLAT